MKIREMLNTKCFHSVCTSALFRCLPLDQTVLWLRQDYLRLWHCHLAWGSTCALEVLILILNGLDTKTNKLSSAHQAGLKNYGNGEGYAIIAANLRSQNQPHLRCPQPPLYFEYRGARDVCVYVWMVSEKGSGKNSPLQLQEGHAAPGRFALLITYDQGQRSARRHLLLIEAEQISRRSKQKKTSSSGSKQILACVKLEL